MRKLMTMSMGIIVLIGTVIPLVIAAHGILTGRYPLTFDGLYQMLFCDYLEALKP